MKLTLAAWRRAKNISQEEMAKSCGISIVTYRTWERDPGKIRIDDAVRIADILQIPLDDIILSSNTTENSIMVVTAKEGT